MNNQGVAGPKTLSVVGTAIGLAVAIGLYSSGELFPGFHLASPDTRYVASFYGRGGGGAAGWLFEYVSINSAGEPFEKGSTVLQMNRGYEACLYWREPRHLVVRVPSSAEIVETKTRVNLGEEIQVSFEAEPSSDVDFVSQTCPGRIGRIRGVDQPWDE